jgi:hypothetical protein
MGDDLRIKPFGMLVLLANMDVYQIINHLAAHIGDDLTNLRLP